MTGLVILVAISQWNWHVELIYTGDPYHVIHTLVNSNNWPVICGTDHNGDIPFFLEWTGTTWELSWVPDTLAGRWDDFQIWFIGPGDTLWAQVIHENYPHNSYRMRFLKYKDGTWDTLPNFRTFNGYIPGQLLIDTAGVPIYPCGCDTKTMLIFRLESGGWKLKDSVKYTLDWWLQNYDVIMDENGHLYVANTDGYHIAYGTNLSGPWEWMWMDSGPTCYPLPPSLFVDGNHMPHLLYNFDAGDNLYRYARRDPFGGGWLIDTTDVMGASNLVVDPRGYVHFLSSSGDTTYHIYRDPSDGSWHKQVIMPVGGKGSIAVDSDGYLHAAIIHNYHEIYYMTTNPNIGVSETKTVPQPSLILSPVPHGFVISGYSGPAQIYDPAGRLILTKNIKGKTRIGPLRPGVYMVVAGRQRGKAVVR